MKQCKYSTGDTLVYICRMIDWDITRIELKSVKVASDYVEMLSGTHKTWKERQLGDNQTVQVDRDQQ
jgi:hypothetical protein